MMSEEVASSQRSGIVSINKHLGTLFINVIEAKELDLQGHSAGHANIKVVLNIGKKKSITKTRSDSFSPVWNEGPFIFDEVFNTDLLSIDVRHKATVGHGFSFGEASFGLFTAPVSQYELRSIPLTTSKGQQGYLTLEIKFEPQQVIVPQRELSGNPIEMKEMNPDGSLGYSRSSYQPTPLPDSTIGLSPVHPQPVNPNANPLMFSTRASNTYYVDSAQPGSIPPSSSTPNRPLSASTPVRQDLENTFQPTVQHHLPNLPLEEAKATVLGNSTTITSVDHNGKVVCSSQSKLNEANLLSNSEPVHPTSSNSTITVDENPTHTVQSSPSSLQNSAYISRSEDVTKERRGFLKAFREERSNRKNASFKALFSLSESEKLVFDSSAAIQRNMLHHGRLYGSTHYLCFYSNVFGIKIMERIALADIASVEKENRNVVNPGITVRTKEGQEYHFASMASRRKTFHKLVDVWRSARDGVVPVERFSDDDFSNIEDRDDDSDHSEMPEPRSGKEVVEEKVEEKVVVAEEKLDAEITSEPGQSIIENLDKMVEVFSTELPVSPLQFFSYFHSDSSDFPTKYHSMRGDKDIVIQKWSNSPPNGRCRTLTCIAPVTASFGPKQTRLEERQRCVVEQNKVIIQLSSRLLDIPYGDHFKVETQHEAVSVGDNKVKLTVSTYVNFVKKTMFEGKIRNGTMSQMGESYQKWSNMALAEIRRRQKLHSRKATKMIRKEEKDGKVIKTVAVSDSDEEEMEEAQIQSTIPNTSVNVQQNLDTSPSLISVVLSSTSPQLIIGLLLLLFAIILMIQVSSLGGRLHSLEERLEFLNRALLLSEMQRNAIHGNIPH